MDLISVFFHLLNFALPALVTGTLLALLAPLVGVRRRPAFSLVQQMLVNALSGVLALIAGLLYFGHDGKMASYGAMVLLCASAQWALSRGSRR